MVACGSPGAAIEGIVQDVVTSEPVGNVRVKVETDTDIREEFKLATSTAETSSDGRFLLRPLLAERPYTLSLAHDHCVFGGLREVRSPGMALTRIIPDPIPAFCAHSECLDSLFDADYLLLGVETAEKPETLLAAFPKPEKTRLYRSSGSVLILAPEADLSESGIENVTAKVERQAGARIVDLQRIRAPRASVPSATPSELMLVVVCRSETCADVVDAYNILGVAALEYGVSTVFVGAGPFNDRLIAIGAFDLDLIHDGLAAIEACQIVEERRLRML